MNFNLFNTKKDLWFRLTIVPLMGLITPFLTNIVPDGVGEGLFIAEHPYLFTVGAVVLMFEVNRICMRFFRRKLKNYSTVAFRLILQLIALIFISLSLMVFLLFFWYEYILNVLDFSEFIVNNVYLGLSVAIIFTMYYEMFYYISIWQKESKLNQSLEIENVKSQLHLLKRQLSPHFLFNSLSTLSSLIETNKDEALSFLDRFSDAYRYLLTHDDEVLSSLISELDFVEIYISILKSNYGNALNFTINVDRNLSKLTVPTLSL